MDGSIENALRGLFFIIQRLGFIAWWSGIQAAILNAAAFDNIDQINVRPCMPNSVNAGKLAMKSPLPITIVVILHFATAPIFAQMNSGEITGSVRDQLNGVIPGAAISLEQAATGIKFTAATNTAGEYLLAQLPIGKYSFKVSAASFKQAVLPDVQVHAGEKLRRDFVLQVGDASEVLVVEAQTGALLSDSAEIRGIIENQELNSLPLKSRQFLDLAMLSEGVVRPPGGSRGDAMQQAGTLVNILGQRSGHNLYLVDGVTVTDEHFNNLVIAPSIDSIEEFNIEKTSYTAEFGGKSGAVINVVTKSGVNALHGTLFEFLRNNVFDAKNFFDSAAAPIPPFRENQFGGSLGGRIVRDRTFYFVNYEGQRIVKSLTQTFSVPTAAMRGGDLSGLPTIYDPSTTNAAGARLPFAGNRITRLDPVAVALLANVPLPNLPGNAQNLRATGVQNVRTNAYSARVDHQLSRIDSAYLRASIFDARQSDPFGSGALQESLLPGFGRLLSTHALNGVAAWTHVFNADAVNEARFGFLTVAGGQQSPNAGNAFASQTGLLGVTTNPVDMGFPQISLGGQFSTLGDPALFTFRNNRSFEFFDNATLHHGRQTLKFGGYAMHYNLQTTNPNGARGIFSFTPRWTSSAAGAADGNAFADFLLGAPTTAQAGLGRAALNGGTEWMHLYLQDAWQAAPNFRIELGLRYEYNRNMTDAENQIALVDPSVPGGRVVVASDDGGHLAPSAAALLPLLPIPYISSAAAGWNRSLLTTKPVRLAPRAGFAWTLPGRLRTTAIRGGFGIYPNQAAYSIVTNLAQNLPFFVTKTVTTAAAAQRPPFSTETALTSPALGTVGANDLNHQFQIEYNEVWNFSIERRFASSTGMTLSYIGSRTVHADSATVLNVPQPGPGAIAPRRPISQLSQFNTIRWDGWAKYHALTADVKRRFSRNLTFDANWTWSHSIDDASDPGPTLNETNLPQNVYDMAAEKATSSFDHRQRLVGSFVYRLPEAGKTGRSSWARMANRAAANWQAGGYFTAQTGAPFTVNIASDRANIGSGPAQRPDLWGDPNAGPHTPGQWFDPAVFRLPDLYHFGNAPRNAVIGPGLQELDLTLQKDIAMGERLRLELRFEAYNVLNRANFGIPNRTAFTPNFGTISSAQDARQLQFALKLGF